MHSLKTITHRAAQCTHLKKFSTKYSLNSSNLNGFSDRSGKRFTYSHTSNLRAYINLKRQTHLRFNPGAVHRLPTNLGHLQCEQKVEAELGHFFLAVDSASFVCRELNMPLTPTPRSYLSNCSTICCSCSESNTKLRHLYINHGQVFVQPACNTSLKVQLCHCCTDCLICLQKVSASMILI